MGLFIGLMSWSILSSSIFLLKGNYKNTKIIYILLVYIPLILISGLRNWNVGTDTMLFHLWYDGTKSVDIEDFGWFYNLLDVSKGTSIEWGFVWIGHFLNILGLNAQVMIFIYSMVTILGIAYAFYKYSRSLWLSTFLYIALFSYAESLNIAKQSVSVMIMLNAFGYLRDNYRLKYLKMIILASIFHFSAIVYGLVLFLMPIKIKKSIYGLFIFFILGFFCWNIILMFADSISIKYLLYIDTDFMMGNRFGAGIIQILGIVFLMCIAYFQYKRKKFNIEEKKEIIICSVFMILLIMTIYFQYVINIIYRFIPYTFVYIYILIPLIVEKITVKSMFIRFVVYTIIIVLGFIYCMICINLGWNGIIPYSFCF